MSFGDGVRGDRHDRRRTGTLGMLPPLLVALAPGILLAAVGVGAFLGIYDAVRDQDDLALLDDPVLEWFVAHRSALATTALTLVTNAFGPVVLPILVAVGALVWGKVTRTWRDPALLVGAMVLSTIVSTVIKVLVARPRPPDEQMSIAGVESTFSFPSGHTIGAATLVFVTGYLIWSRHHTGRRLTVWALTSAVVVSVVALSRLYLGYHFVTDVLAATSLALAVLGIVVALHRWAELEDVADGIEKVGTQGA